MVMAKQGTAQHVTRPTKRQRTRPAAFGAPSAADSPSTQQNNPSSSALSTRNSPSHIPALTTLCARAFVTNAKSLAADQDSDVWKSTIRWLKALPEHLVPRVFAMLRASCPTILSDTFITTHFLRGSSVTLTRSLPGVVQKTITSIGQMGTSLRDLVLDGFDKYPDTLFAHLIRHLPSLQVLVLRGCTQVGANTVAAAARCIHLRTVNLNYTAASPVSLAPLLIACNELEVLKVAGIPHWTDATFSKLKDVLVSQDNFKLPCLRTLKLRQTALSDHSIHFLISLCPNLKRLDLSFTTVRRLSVDMPPLEKLSLTSTGVTGTDLMDVISRLPQLKTLSLGVMGGGTGSSAKMGNSSALTLTPAILRDLTDVLDHFEYLENVSLVGNTKLYSMESSCQSLANFVRNVGRKCKKLNLAGIHLYSDAVLDGLLPSDQGYSSLDTLVLDNTQIDDSSAVYISSCPMLRCLEVAGTRFTREGLFQILDACPNLEKLDLTSCRGINVSDRRRFFEVWEEGRMAVEEVVANT